MSLQAPKTFSACECGVFHSDAWKLKMTLLEHSHASNRNVLEDKPVSLGKLAFHNNMSKASIASLKTFQAKGKGKHNQYTANYTPGTRETVNYSAYIKKLTQIAINTILFTTDTCTHVCLLSLISYVVQS